MDKLINYLKHSKAVALAIQQGRVAKEYLRHKPYVIPLGVVLLLVYDYTHSIHFNRLDLDQSELMIRVEQGDSFTSVLAKLDQQGILPKEKWVDFSVYAKIYAKLSASERHIEAGQYIVRPGDTFADLVGHFVQGDSIYVSFRVAEGARTSEVLDKMRTDKNIRWIDYNMPSLLQFLHIRQTSLEGWLLPDTYRFHEGIQSLDLLKHIHQTMVDVLMKNWQDRDPDLPLKTPYEALILASIIEKEAALDREKRRIAAVFINRLNKGMLLQADPTVIYGLGDAYQGNLTKAHLKADTPYNTYTRKGLPPTPIAMPSESSIYAATHPTKEDILYFVSMGNGAHYFSKTYDTHRRAVYRYQIKPHRKKKQSKKKDTAQQ